MEGLVSIAFENKMAVNIEPLISRYDPPADHVRIFLATDIEIRFTLSHDLISFALGIAKDERWNTHELSPIELSWIRWGL